MAKLDGKVAAVSAGTQGIGMGIVHKADDGLLFVAPVFEPGAQFASLKV